jgi:raffinose/stachyose/melibiose transport system substrate-binding protein
VNFSNVRTARRAAAGSLVLLVSLAIGLWAVAGTSANNDTVIHVWDYGARPSTSHAYDAIYRKFEALHPGVKIERRSFSGGGDFQTAFGPAMAAGKGPDVWAGGVSDQLIKDGQVLDLTSSYCQFGWNKSLNPGQIRLTERSGKIYEIPDSIESLVVFYNRDVFRKLGVGIPKTWPQLLHVVAVAKQHNLIPFAYGNSEKFVGGAFWHGALIAGGLGAKAEQNLLFGNGKWDSNGVVGALNAYVGLSEAGAFPKASVSLTNDDALSLFAQKKAAMFLTGTYVLTEVSGASVYTRPNTGVFLLPSWNPRVPTQATEQSGNNWLANARTSDPKLVAQLLNYLLFNRENQRILVEQTNDVLAIHGLGAFKLSPQLRRVRQLVDSLPASRVSYSYLASLVPADLSNAFFDDMQALQIGKSTPAQTAAKWQALWQKEKSAGQTLHPGNPPKCR